MYVNIYRNTHMFVCTYVRNLPTYAIFAIKWSCKNDFVNFLCISSFTPSMKALAASLTHLTHRLWGPLQHSSHLCCHLLQFFHFYLHFICRFFGSNFHFLFTRLFPHLSISDIFQNNVVTFGGRNTKTKQKEEQYSSPPSSCV